jgi:AcrR family transcriptional regulator
MVRKSNRRSIATGRSPRAAARRDATRAAILRAAARIFRTRGFAETGMRDIADAAGLSPANLYHYFRGKDEILFYCQDRALDRMLAGAARARRAAGPVPERLYVVLSGHLQVMLDEVEGATAHLQTEALSPAFRERIVAKRDRYEKALRALVALGVSKGECVAPDPALAVRAMMGALNWTVTWFNPAGPRSTEAVAAEIATLLVRGVASTSSLPTARRLTMVSGRAGREDQT